MGREDTIRSLQGTVSKMEAAGYDTGAPKLRQTHETANGGKKKKKKEAPNYIPVNLQRDDKVWLKNFLDKGDTQ